MDHPVRTVDLRAKLLALGIKNHIGTSLLQAHAAQQQALPNDTEYSDLLDSFFVATKQLDDMYSEITPMFALIILTPKRPLVCPPSLYTLPQLLSTAVAQEETDGIRIPAAATTATAEKQAREALGTHNTAMEALVFKFNAQLDAWKKDARKKEQTESRKRKIKLEEEAEMRGVKKLAVFK